MPLKPLRPIRTPSSERLDDQTVRVRGGKEVTIPRARPWPEVYDYLATHWRVGQHMSLVGMPGSGKTTFAREALLLRDWVVVFGTKARDPDLYQQFQRQGYVLKTSWSPFDTSNPRVIFAPPLPDPSARGRAIQAEAFRKVLMELFQITQGNWTVYADEIRYLTDNLKLSTEWETLELQGRSLGVTLVTSTQRPRRVPREIFAAAEWHGFWRISNVEDRNAASELIGGQSITAREAMAILPRHEMLLVNSVTDDALRTKVYT